MTESSSDFSPSILHNKKGPLNPSFRPMNSTDNALTPYVPVQVNKVLKDRRALAIICLILPPLAVFLKTGASRKFLFSIILTLFIFPGILYGFYVTFLEATLNPSSNVSEV